MYIEIAFAAVPFTQDGNRADLFELKIDSTVLRPGVEWLGFEGEKKRTLQISEDELYLFNDCVEGNLLAALGGDLKASRYLLLSNTSRWANFFLLERLLYRLAGFKEAGKIERLVSEASRVMGVYRDKAAMVIQIAF